MPFDAIIFDNDGVLVDTAELASATLAKVLAEHDVDLPDTDVASLFGASMTSVVAAVRSRTGRQLPTTFVDRFHDEIEAAVGTEARPIPGVEGLLESLSVPLAVASNGTRSRIETLLRCAGLHRWFEGRIFSAWDVPLRKPAPDVFLAAAEAVGVPPARCVVVEDSVEGIEAANAAGMIAVAFSSSSVPGARVTVADMQRLGGLLQSAPA